MPRNSQAELQRMSVSSHHASIDHAQETQKEMFKKASEKALIKKLNLQRQIDHVTGISKSRTRE